MTFHRYGSNMCYGIVLVTIISIKFTTHILQTFGVYKARPKTPTKVKPRNVQFSKHAKTNKIQKINRKFLYRTQFS